MSVEYYNQNAEEYINDTINADLHELYKLFENYLKPGDTILDIGCGSGRDSRYFLEKGYEVYAHDASTKMVAYSKRYLKNRVTLATFQNFNPETSFGSTILFNGLWACSSLLHVPEKNMYSILNKYLRFLNNHGVFFMSFKRRKNNHKEDGRRFTNFTKEKLFSLLHTINEIQILECTETNDVRKNRENENWLSVVVGKR